MLKSKTIDKIIWEWTINQQSLRVVKQFLPNMQTEKEITETIEKQEKILKNNGYLYKWSVRLLSGDTRTEYIFRKHEIVRHRTVHNNLTRKIQEEWVESRLEQVNLCE